MHITSQELATVHFNDVIMNAMASQITSLTIVYSAVYSGANQRKHQSSASLAFVRGIHRVNSPHKGPVTRSMFPFDDVIMNRPFGDVAGTGRFYPNRRHDVEKLFAILALCEENPLVTDGFPSKRSGNVGLWYFLRSQHSQLEKALAVGSVVSWDIMTLLWRHPNHSKSPHWY